MKERCYALVADADFINRQDQLTYDVAIVGAGIAGMAVALNLNPKLKVIMANKSVASDSSTFRAQGGIAVAIGPDDSPEKHMADTLRVGQGLCREEAVRILAQEGPAALAFLQRHGVDFNFQESGLDLTREAGHSCHRVVHYYDYTGRQISQTLRNQVNTRKNITQLSDSFLVDIITVDEECCGCIFLFSGKLIIIKAKAVVIASGGYAGLFARSSNSRAASGDGIAAAYRAGAAIADMEFVQFHPTTFTTVSGEVFLLTEALRGEGSYLRNSVGDRFMFSYHCDGELAPRDEISRAITREIALTGKPVYLDARSLGRDKLTERFRQVYAKLAENNYYMEKDLIPVEPAAHYTIGGIMTDLWGTTNIRRLYACGEAAATGVHGANRLASNSLLEGVVFGLRVAAALNEGEEFSATCVAGELPAFAGCQWGGDLDLLSIILEQAAGVVRDGNRMAGQLQVLRHLSRSEGMLVNSASSFNICNAYQLTELILAAALSRRESRGTHYRADYPEKNDDKFSKHIVQQWGGEVILK